MDKTEFRKILFVFILNIIFIFGANMASAGPISGPSSSINSLDGNITIGVHSRYGGAIVYYKDKRISDDTVANGNIIDYSNGGTLFTTAIWTMPVNHNEEQYCYDSQKINGICPGSNYFNNPTQGGYLGDGWAGNPNSTSVSVANNKINVSYRAVNYNYAYSPVKPLTTENENEWQTDFWGDVEISFHPILKDVVVVDTKITYCKYSNSRCGNQSIVVQDNQLSTMFAAGNSHPDASFQGPYGRFIYKNNSSYAYPSSGIAQNNFENWVAILQRNRDVGLGISVYNYRPTISGRFGYSMTEWPSLTAMEPELNKFEISGLSREDNEIPRYRFEPGGWYKFRTFVATGDTNKIRWDLLRAQDSNFSGNIESQISGYVDRFSCADIAGWAKDDRNLSDKLTIRAYIYPVDEPNSSVVVTGTANSVRSDLSGTCSSDGRCAFDILLSSLPSSFSGKKLKADIYGVASDGEKNKIYSENLNIFGSCQISATNQSPVATISSISPDSTYVGQSVSFSGSGTDSDGTIVGYNWRSSIDGQLSTTNSFTKSNLSMGTHTIYFKVQDDDGMWSNEVSRSLTVSSVPTVNVSLSASSSSIYAGQSTTLTWSAANATSCTASNAWSGTKATSGSSTVSPTQNSTYTLTCTGNGGATATQSTTISVSAVPTISISLSAAASTVYAGQSTTLTWSAANATSCTASNAWSGTKATSGSSTVSPTQNSTYTLTCTGNGGATATQSTTISVSAVPTNVAPIFIGIGNKTIIAENNLNFTISAIDTDNDALTYSVTVLPSGSNFNTNTKIFNWTPTSIQVGEYNVNFVVSDGELIDSETVIITVVAKTTGNQFPISKIDSIPSDYVVANQSVSFSGSGTDSDGTIVGYNWRSSIDGQLSTTNSFTKSNLSMGTHTIYFKVQDDDGMWSNEVSQNLVIKSQIIQPAQQSSLIKTSGDNKIYKIIDNKKFWIPTAEVFNKMGYNWNDIETVNETNLNTYPRIKLVKPINGNNVYYLTNGGLKRWIKTEKIFNAYNNRWEDIVEISATELVAIPDNNLIKLENGTKVYKIENNKKRWIQTAEAFNRLGYDWNQIAPVNQIELDSYLTGLNIK